MRPSRAAAWCFLLSLIGIGVCAYLVYLHLGLLRGELLGGPVCGSSGPLNCHAVTAGTWGSFLGMPLAFWGLIGYVAIVALSLLAWQSPEWADHALTLIAALASVFVLLDLFLLALMVWVIRFYCLFCLLTYAINLILLIVSVRGSGRAWLATLHHVGRAIGTLVPSSQRPAAWLFWGVMLVGVLASVGVYASTTFVSQGAWGSVRKQIREFVSKQPRVALHVDEDPKIGSPNAPLQIVEFSDLFCPACQRASKLNTIILANHRQDAVFIFKHFPLDTSCNEKVSRVVHPGACQVAAASECAHLQGKFWPFHDLIFEQGQHYNMANLEADVKRLGVDVASFHACMESGQGMEAVKRDIADAASAGVQSTPTYVINGVPIAGGLSPSVFDDFVAVLRENEHR